VRRLGQVSTTLRQSRRRAVAALFAPALAACGGARSNGGGHGVAGSEAPHAPFPSVLYQQGAVLSAPKLVTVTFPGDPLAAQLQAFDQTLASSPYWNEVRAGYCADPSACAGDGPAGTSVVLTTAPGASYTDSDVGGPSTLQTWLAGEIASGALPKPDANPVTETVYVLYFPTTTTITFDGTTSCSDFDGYHASMTMGSQQVVYAVVNECPPVLPGPGAPAMTMLQATTLSASHEVVEAITDPSDLSAGYYLDLSDPASWGWNDVEGGEVADLCVDPFGYDQDWTADGAFTAQRIWSIPQASAGADPCSPEPAGEVYFNAAPKEAFFVVNVGGSVTFEVDAFATGPTANWTLTAQDWSPSPATYLTFSIAGGNSTDAGPAVSVNNGSRVTVTATLTQDPGGLFTGEADGAIVSFAGDPAQPSAAHYWPIVVMSPADAQDAGLDAALTGGRRVAPGRAHGRRRPPVHRLARMALTRALP
jgi:hypothetical protein